jgi:hypothetical protein
MQDLACLLPGFFPAPVIFSSIMVITMGRHRQLAKPLKSFQLEYLKALGVTAGIFTMPSLAAKNLVNLASQR